MAIDNERRELFRKYIQVYEKDIFRIIYNVFFDKYLADELTQEVMLNAWKGLHTLKDVKKSKAWVKTITRNVIREHMKKKSFDLTKEEADLANDFERHEEFHKAEDDILEIIVRQENAEKISLALKRIDPVYRMIITNHVIGEVTLKDISRNSGMSYSSVKDKYKLGLKHLRREYMRLERGGDLNGQKED